MTRGCGIVPEYFGSPAALRAVEEEHIFQQRPADRTRNLIRAAEFRLPATVATVPEEPWLSRIEAASSKDCERNRPRFSVSETAA